MSILLEHEPWLFVRVDRNHKDAFRDSADLLVQYTEVEGFPVVYLTLVESQKQGAYVCRAVLDPFASTDRQFLEALGRSFSARVAFFCGETYLETRDVSAFREQLVLEILKLTEAAPVDTEISAAEALKRAIETPPEFVADALPFDFSAARPTTLETTIAAVDRMVPWMTEERLRLARFIYSIPVNVIETSISNVISSALELGVALPLPFYYWAIEHSMAADLPTMVGEQLREFAARSDQSTTELGIEPTAANWRLLLETAETCHLEEVAPSIYEAASRAIDAANALAETPEKC